MKTHLFINRKCESIQQGILGDKGILGDTRTHPSKVTLPNTATKRAARTSNPFILLLEVKFLIVSNPFIYHGGDYD